MIRHIADVSGKAGKNTLSEVLLDIINTPVSPELLPLCDGENNQHTEKIVGPYELHDFFLYYTVKYGFTKKKISRLAKAAFSPEYAAEDIDKYLDIFFRRFLTQQFKRSCMPDGPRVSEISLSPRGAWRMPSDASSDLWKK
jgi:NAD+ synthase (glutamine-hydrolysing)